MILIILIMIMIRFTLTLAPPVFPDNKIWPEEKRSGSLQQVNHFQKTYNYSDRDYEYGDCDDDGDDNE